MPAKAILIGSLLFLLSLAHPHVRLSAECVQHVFYRRYVPLRRPHDLRRNQRRQKDFDDILRIYACAREYMKHSGNPTQWRESFPPEALINDDIWEKRNYVVEADGGIHGLFAFILGADPTYARIVYELIPEEAELC